MKDILLATYERGSTLWKNANYFYKLQDWTKMECIFQDWSEVRESGVRYFKDGKDITEEMTYDRYIIRLTNKGGFNHQSYPFKTREEANAWFKKIMADKVLGNFKKVK